MVILGIFRGVGLAQLKFFSSIFAANPVLIFCWPTKSILEQTKTSIDDTSH